LAAGGIAVGVALRSDDLPPPGAARRPAIQARQQRALDALPAGSFRLKRRYTSVSGFAGWAQRAAIEALLDHPETRFVYLDGTVHATLAEGAGLIGANTAHAFGVTGSGVRVAVLDTGIDTDHPDLSDDLAAQQCFCDDHPSPRFGCCPSGGQTEANAEDDDGHGTSVSGIITSSRAAGPGVAPDAEIVAVKVLDSGGNGSFSDIAAGLDWVLTNHAALGIRIVNTSLGDGGEYNNPSASPCTGTNTATAIESLHAAGVTVFVSSGNDAHDDGISFPACVAEAISVGGVYDAALSGVSWCGNATCTVILCTDNPTAADVFVCHSNSDELLDILAPDWKTDTAALGGGTTAIGGTSASSPYAAAEAALLLQVDGSLTPEQIRTLMKANGPAVVNPDNGLSFTRSDVAAALLVISPGTCGNDVVEFGEECDDGNTADGDCCSATCAFEVSGSSCQDGDACTVSDTCDGSGGCNPGAPRVCDDGAFCNGAETCDAGSGCLDGPDPVLDDAIACTDDSCDEVGDVVVHAPNDVLCDDSNACTADACDVFEGCSHTPIAACTVTGVPTSTGWGQALIVLMLVAAGVLALVQRRRVTS
jgi:cysteine-rich repeat protein